MAEDFPEEMTNAVDDTSSDPDVMGNFDADVTKALDNFKTNTTNVEANVVQEQTQILKKSVNEAAGKLMNSIAEKFNENVPENKRLPSESITPEAIQNGLDTIGEALTSGGDNPSTPLTLDEKLQNIYKNENLSKLKKPLVKAMRDMNGSVAELAAKNVGEWMKRKIGGPKYNARANAIAKAQGFIEDWVNKVTNEDGTINGKALEDNSLDKVMRKVRAQGRIIDKIEGPEANAEGANKVGEGSGEGSGKDSSGKSDKTSWDAKKIMLLVSGLLSILGSAGLAIYLAVVAHELTGCYKYIGDGKKSTEIGPFISKCLVDAKKSRADAQVYCDCSDIDNKDCDCGSSLNCKGEELSAPGIIAGKYYFPDANNCSGDNQFYPPCCSTTGSKGCDPSFPICQGMPPQKDSLAYGWKIVTIGDVIGKGLSGLGGLASKGFAQLLVYIGIAAGIIIGGYAIYALIRSFSNGSGDSKTEVVEVKK